LSANSVVSASVRLPMMLSTSTDPDGSNWPRVLTSQEQHPPLSLQSWLHGQSSDPLPPPMHRSDQPSFPLSASEYKSRHCELRIPDCPSLKRKTTTWIGRNHGHLADGEIDVALKEAASSDTIFGRSECSGGESPMWTARSALSAPKGEAALAFMDTGLPRPPLLEQTRPTKL